MPLVWIISIWRQRPSTASWANPLPHVLHQRVADHALSMILALNRRIVQFDRDLRSGAWVTHTHHMDKMLRGPIPPLREMTVGIVGIGRIGTEVAARLAPFKVRIWHTTRMWTTTPFETAARNLFHSKHSATAISSHFTARTPRKRSTSSTQTHFRE